MSADPKFCIERSATVAYTEMKQNTHNFEQLFERVLTQRSLPNNQLQLLQGHRNNNIRQDWLILELERPVNRDWRSSASNKLG